MTDKATERHYKTYDYGAREPVYVNSEDLTEQQRYRLMQSDTFCILPWIHMHAFPDGRAYPCCMSLMEKPIGSLRDNTMEELWNSEDMKEMRRNMLEDKPCSQCTKCYEQESNGFFSMRNAQNKNMGHHVTEADKTNPDGSLNDFKLRYYDIRFSNLCNMACRSCGDIFSSLWRRDAKKYKWVSKDAPNIDYAGRYKMDMWEQLQPHIDYIENIYFAGGEPLIMEEHYRLLNELLDRGRTEVRLVYNTNFSELAFKNQNVLDLWNQFDSVSVGASLDAMGPRAEIMRHGTKWENIVRNRERMLEVCPQVDFYISATLSVMNSYHLPDFHREWVDRGLIKPQDFNVNILQGPGYYRLDVLPEHHKRAVEEKYKQHIEWLEPHDHLKRAVNGYKSAINFMSQNQNEQALERFIHHVNDMDSRRNEKFWDTFPELRDLNE